LNLREAIALEYAKGHITEEELQELLGADIEDVKTIVNHLKKGKQFIDTQLKKKTL